MTVGVGLLDLRSRRVQLVVARSGGRVGAARQRFGLGKLIFFDLLCLRELSSLALPTPVAPPNLALLHPFGFCCVHLVFGNLFLFPFRYQVTVLPLSLP